MKYSMVLLAFAATVIAQSQIKDGQVQAPTGAASQIKDGQVQAPTAAVTPSKAATQIKDGQVQAPTAAATQIKDGQVQAPVASTGSIPKPTANGTFATSTPSPSAFAGAGSVMSWSKEIALAAVGAAAGFAML